MGPIKKAVAAALILAGFVLLTSCVIGGVGEGAINLLVTGGLQEDWREISVSLKSIEIFKDSNTTWEEVWAADAENPDTGRIDLVALTGAAAILGNRAIPAGTYDRIRLTLDADPAHMTLIDIEGLAVASADIVVIDPEGAGQITADLEPAVSLAKNETENVQIAVDLAHPLSIARVDDKVVLNLQVGRKALPAAVDSARIARTVGDVAAADVADLSFTLRSVQAGEVTFVADASTAYLDADTGQAGNFGALASLAGTGSALVASSLTAGREIYARTVWYAAGVTTLPPFAPEGLVRAVGPDRITLVRPDVEEPAAGLYRPVSVTETVLVDADTTWTFLGVDMGTGPAVLPFIDTGYRIEVGLVDPAAPTRVAASVEVVSAAESGLVASAGPQSFVFGDSSDSEIMLYSAVTGHAFSWQRFGLTDSLSTSITEFVDLTGEAATAGFRLAGIVSLAWDAENTRWVVEDILVVPVRLAEQTLITTGYTGTSGTMELATYDPWDGVAPLDLTVSLDTGGDEPTAIASLVVDEGTGEITSAYPVSAAGWEALLVPALPKILISIRPEVATDGAVTWHAFTVLTKRTLP